MKLRVLLFMFLPLVAFARPLVLPTLPESGFADTEIVSRLFDMYAKLTEGMGGKATFDDGKVYINGSQYFAPIPEAAWNFYIGGYQPAQKWLKDRKGRVLTSEDQQHYRAIIAALVKTDALMKALEGGGE